LYRVESPFLNGYHYIDCSGESLALLTCNVLACSEADSFYGSLELFTVKNKTQK